MRWWDCQEATSSQGVICSCFLVVTSVHLFFCFFPLSALCCWFKAILLVKTYTNKAFRELALCKSTGVASEGLNFEILLLGSIYSIDDRFITYASFFPFYDNHRSKPCLAVIPWKSPEDRLNLSSEDKPDDQVKPLTPLTHPPPPQKKNNSGHHSCDTTKIYLKCSRSIQPFCRCTYRAANKERGAGTRDFPWPLKAWPLSTYSQLFNFPSANCIYLATWNHSSSPEYTYIFYLYHSQICLTLLQRLRLWINAW